MVSPFVQPNAARACSNAALRATVSTSPGASWPTTTMRRFAPDRCARAAIGQAAAPPIKVTNSRRFIRPTSSAVMNRGRACSPVLPTERIAYLGRGVRLLRCGISNQLMSQMGHQWTSRSDCETSALPPTTAMTVRRIDVRKVPATEVAASFDYLVGAGEQRKWDGETERLCGLEVYNQLDLRRLHDRQVGRLLALKYFPGVVADQTI